MKPLPAELIHATLPRPGEEHLEYWGPVTTEYNRERFDGYLVLTNQRLTFVRVTKTLTPLFFTPLDVIYQIGQSKRSRLVVLHVNELEFRAKESVVSGWPGGISDLVSSISRARESWLHEVARASEAQRASVLTSPNPQVVREREIIREIVRLPCRFCGALIEQTSIKCPSCGATLRA